VAPDRFCSDESDAEWKRDPIQEIQILYSNSTANDHLTYANLSHIEAQTTIVDMGSLSSKYLNQLLSRERPMYQHARCRCPDFHTDPDCARKSLFPPFPRPPTIPLLVRCLLCISERHTMRLPQVDRLQETPSFHQCSWRPGKRRTKLRDSQLCSQNNPLD